MPTAGVMGATGYMGGEALRVLLEHPDVELAWASSRTPDRLDVHHPNLLGCGLRTIPPEDVTPCDAVFLALPPSAAIGAAAQLLDQGCRVIDLGAAFRLRDRSLWERTYGQTHERWDLAEEAVYGISELYLEAIAGAKLVANPGCFSTAAILALAPLANEAGIDLSRIVVMGMSGTAGMGAELTRAGHHAEIGSNLVPYNVVGHRHTLEIEQELKRLAGAPVRIHFTPVYVPVVRGILDVCYLFTDNPPARADLLERYRGYYADSPFVEICDLPFEDGATWQHQPYPWVSAVAGTNRCHIGIDVDRERGRIALLAALDSIGKGGAQAGVENMNLMLGLERTAGLGRRGLHP